MAWAIANRLKLKRRFSTILDYPDEEVKAHSLTAARAVRNEIAHNALPSVWK
jgi:hypothetical protein